MKATNLRENVLNKIRAAAKTNKQKFEITEPDFKSPIYKKSDESLPEMFAKEFNKNYGKFIYCRNDKDFIQQYNQLVEANRWVNILSTEESLFGLLDASNIKYNKTLKNHYENAVNYQLLEILAFFSSDFSATSFSDFLTQLTFLLSLLSFN